MAMSLDEIMPIFIEYLIAKANGKYCHLTNTIRKENFKYEEDTITVFVVGERIAEELNESLSMMFSQLLKDTFGYNYKFVFSNDEKAYEKAEQDKKKITTLVEVPFCEKRNRKETVKLSTK